MSKLSRKERKEEEKRIIAEMDAAMAENKEKGAENALEDQEEGAASENVAKKTKKTSFYDATTPETVHCKRCKTLMENGVCPTCGFRIYVPMDKEKRDKIRLWVTVVCLGVFFILFLMSQMKNG